MLSLHTNAAAMNIKKAIGNTSSCLNTTMTRLGTGLRINSAKDDAAGLQIAVRLQAQTRGMGMAMQNTQNASSLLQTADGAMKEVTNILYRMKDLATQAADGSSSANEKSAMQAEYDALGKELSNIMKNTSYGGAKLMQKEVKNADDTVASEGGRLTKEITFQIGATKDETMTVDFSKHVTNADTKFEGLSATYKGPAEGTPEVAGEELTKSANATIDLINNVLDDVGALRSAIGAAENRLEHTHNNLANMSTNTADAEGRIMDADMASESAKMSSQQVLLQASMSMLKQTSSMNQMVLSLLQ
ncbi:MULTISPECIES: flagellin [Burkholderia]|uniref:flagellin N-terminal helical domain-containing protein n=1 Tax=Burkholderia TaxID=32008 RepID=UPI0006792CA6|nr:MULTISPECIES: flagellin [Burkholderia]KWU25535.1 flagellin [Burkholderia cenocepacia]OXI65879.1 lateral flagellin LafA [Burkholderia sp. AU31280]QRR17645.1 lateral flagellin LafA [Burkholderia sp. MS389]CAG2378314.1 flagellin [Burkholderia cenocepacia]CAG2378419.1 flagellin [Burkholderia cenocepacia]